MKRLLLACLVLSVVQTAALANEPTSASEEEVKARAEAIQKTLRCVVCQNQSIADSNSFLAEDMREIVEQRVRLGETDGEVRAYMQDKYGDFVLMTPPFQLSTWLLWLSPFLLVLLGGVWFLKNARRGTGLSSPAESELSTDERDRLDSLLKSTSDKESDA